MGNHYFGHGDPVGNGALVDGNRSSLSTKHVLGAGPDPRNPTAASLLSCLPCQRSESAGTRTALVSAKVG